MDEVRRVGPSAVVDGVVDEESGGRSGRLQHLRLGRLVFLAQMRILNAVHAANGADAHYTPEICLWI